jgi:hypothetical protein
MLYVLSEPFVKYKNPLTGIFMSPGDEYDIKNGGWQDIPVKENIIGETDDCFVTKLTKLQYGEWIGEEVVQHYKIVPIGFHKSRLKKWLSPIQLNLFL